VLLRLSAATADFALTRPEKSPEHLFRIRSFDYSSFSFVSDINPAAATWVPSYLPLPLPLPLSLLLPLPGLSDLSLSLLPLPWLSSDCCTGGSAAGGAGVVSINCVACGVRSAFLPFPLPWPLSAGAGVVGATLAAGGSADAAWLGAGAGGDSDADEIWVGADAAVVSSGCDAGKTTGRGSLRVEVTWPTGLVDATADEAIVALLRCVT
jgi:hypothetical protein